MVNEFGKSRHPIIKTLNATTGVFQDSWHSLVNFYAASFTGFSGFNVTSPIASQS